MAQHVLEVTEQSFPAEVLQSPVPVVVDFWAPWCGPCRAMAPTLDQFAGERGDTLKVTKLNVDEQGAIATQYGVMSIPTFLVFSGGKPIGQIVGAMPKESFASRVDTIIAGAK